AKPGPECLAQRHPVLRLPLIGDRELSQCGPRCWGEFSSRGSFGRGFLSAFLPEVLVEVVEDLRAPRNPFRVVLGRDAEAIDQSYAGDFGAAELAGLEIDVMDDLRDGAQGWVLQRAALQQHLERAFVALVGELGLEHVEAQLAFVGAIALAGYEFETRFGIDEAPYQPGAGDAINIYAL